MRVLKFAAVALGLGVIGAASVAAQTTTPPSPPNQDRLHRQGPNQDRQMPPSRPDGQRRTPQESEVPPHGVMRPPATGDQNVIQPRTPGRSPMPEIQPPGTPGGNENVQPK